MSTVSNYHPVLTRKCIEHLKKVSEKGSATIIGICSSKPVLLFIGPNLLLWTKMYCLCWGETEFKSKMQNVVARPSIEMNYCAMTVTTYKW